MKVGDYPGIYHMVEIPEQDWHLLPKVPRGKDSVNLDYEAEDLLEKSGYIIGRLQRVIFHDPGIKDTNWSATRPVVGPDGVEKTVGVPALLQGGTALDQLAGSDLRRDAPGHRRRPALPRRPGQRCAPARRQRLPRRGEEHRGRRRLVGGTPAVGGGQPADRQHGAQGGRVHLPGTEPHDRRHPRRVGAGRGPVVRLREPTRLPPRPGHRRHRVPPADAEAVPGLGGRAGVAGARPAEPRRDDVRAGALRRGAQGRRVHASEASS